MSTQRGGGEKRSRPQKYQNKFAFKNDLHDKTPKMKKTNALNVAEVCERCKAQIEYKIKYKKYKPLSQAKTCAGCNNRTITKAYHVYCKECARKAKVCAKCLKSSTLVNIEPPGPTPEEQQKLQVEMERLTKSLSERKRRTFIRFMKKGLTIDNADDLKDGDEPKPIIHIPHTRDQLIHKIKMLKFNDDEDDDDDEFDFSDEENRVDYSTDDDDDDDDNNYDDIDEVYK